MCPAPLFVISFYSLLHLLLGLFLDGLRDGGIRQGRSVPQLFALGYVLQETPHDLARIGLGKFLDGVYPVGSADLAGLLGHSRSEEHTSELQSRQYLVCRLLLEK